MLLSPPLDPKKPSPPGDKMDLPEPLLSPPTEPISPPIVVATSNKKPRRNHSEIERRRRAKLNDRFEELRLLVPECRAFSFAKRGGDPGIHKLDILSGAVRYIQFLHQQIEKQQQQRAEWASVNTPALGTTPAPDLNVLADASASYHQSGIPVEPGIITELRPGSQLARDTRDPEKADRAEKSRLSYVMN